MFEFVRTHSRWLQLILLLLILPSFVALGVQGYTSMEDGAGARVATVDGQKITQAEWDVALREQGERMRRENPQVDAKLLDSPEARKQALDGLVVQRVLDVAVRRQFLDSADARVRSVFQRAESLAFLRNPDGSPNKAILAAQGMSSEMFAQRLRQDLSVRQVLAPAQMVTTQLPQAGKLAFDAALQRREVSWIRVDPAQFRSQVQLTDAEVAAYYELPATQARWKQAERAQIEYLVLDLDALRAGVQVNEPELKTFYEQNRKRYATAEERRARHILVKVDEKAKPEEEQAARAKLEGLLVQLRKDPKQFEELARKHSQDEVSAANGGDLDYFARESMVKPFADAAFALKVGEVSPVVRSEFGLHLIELVAVRGGEVRSFDEVKGEIETERRTELAREQFQKLSEQFSNAVYEQADALQPVAEKMGLKLQTADLPRVPPGGATGPLASSKLVEAVFAPESLRAKRNTEAVETAPQQLVSARVLKHVPAAAPALNEVKDLVREQLLMERAAALAKKDGEAQLTVLSKSASEGKWGEAKWVSRLDSQGLPRQALEKILQASAAKLPFVTGVDLGPGGYLLVNIAQVAGPDVGAVPAEQAAAQYAQALGNAEAAAYMDALKQAFKAKISAAKPAAAEQK